MKRILFAAAALVVSVAINAQTQAFDDVAKLNTDKHDFGKILQGKPVDFYFEITNKSDKPIVIEYAQPSCGCTTPEVPKEPIAPGTTSKIKVTYNAAGMGVFTKNVTIKLVGVDQPKIVTITGEQLAQAEYDQYVKDHPLPAAVTAPEEKSKTKGTKSKTKIKS
jgi:hypothetical protein